MVRRLAEGQRERATMLAGIAHDLRAPLTRLQFRLSMQELNAAERTRCQSDLDALERITGQFLLYADGGEREECIDCPLDQWLAETVAGQPSDQLQLQLSTINAHIRPVARARRQQPGRQCLQLWQRTGCRAAEKHGVRGCC